MPSNVSLSRGWATHHPIHVVVVDSCNIATVVTCVTRCGHCNDDTLLFRLADTNFMTRI